MRGNDLNAGASSGTSNVKNPITLAADVMNHSKHVFLSGYGAEVRWRKQCDNPALRR